MKQISYSMLKTELNQFLLCKDRENWEIYVQLKLLTQEYDFKIQKKQKSEKVYYIKSTNY